MDKKQFLLSIIIPTKNRQEYAEKVIDQVLAATPENVQIVIQDNSDDACLKNLIPNNPRIKYNYNGAELSFVDNFHEAVEIADGEYICIIGDDDGVLSHIFDITQWASENEIEAIIPNTSCVYIWQGNSFVDAGKGRMTMSYINNKTITVDPSKEVDKLMLYGAQKYQSLNTVKVYHGIVKKSCFDKVKNITGHYFGGLSPDIYASVAVSLIVSKAVKINCPITISGICKTSGSADSATGKHTGKLEDAPHFKGHDSYVWAKEVPEFYSVENIWADSALHALDEMNAKEKKQKFSQSALDAFCLQKYSKYKDIVLKHMQKNGISKTKVFMQKIKLIYLPFIKRVFKRLARRQKDVIANYDLLDIASAERQVYINLKKMGFDIESLFNNLKKLL